MQGEAFRENLKKSSLTSFPERLPVICHENELYPSYCCCFNNIFVLILRFILRKQFAPVSIHKLPQEGPFLAKSEAISKYFWSFGILHLSNKGKKKVQIAYSDDAFPKKCAASCYFGRSCLSALRSPTCNSRFSLLALRTTRLAAKTKRVPKFRTPKKNATQLNSNFLKSTEPHHPHFCCSTFFVQPALPTSVARLGIFLFGSSRSNPFPLGTTFFRPRKRETDHQKHGKKQKRLQPI